VKIKIKTVEPQKHKKPQMKKVGKSWELRKK
jgi:hypothetical protein